MEERGQTVMENKFEEPHPDQGSACSICRFWATPCPGRVWNPEGPHSLELQGLCMVHRARASEGTCILCGRRLPWMLMSAWSRLGFCRPCYLVRAGEKEAVALVAFLEDLARYAGFWPAGSVKA